MLINFELVLLGTLYNLHIVKIHQGLFIAENIYST